MLLLAGQRTDIVTWYTPWLMNRVREGFVLVRNPKCPTRVSRYRLDRSVVDCLVLCSKNYRPLLPHVRELDAALPLLCYATVTAYGRDLEPRVPDRKERVASVQALSRLLGKRRLVWRYDPVLVTERYTVETHLEIFAALCAQLAPYVHCCIFSFLHHFPGMEHSPLRFVSEAQELALAQGLARIAGRHQLPLQNCASRRDFSNLGILSRACLSQDLLEEILGKRLVPLPTRKSRPFCHCVEARDLGTYDSCANGCVYCYANTSTARVRASMSRHDPASPLLIGHLHKGDVVTDAPQKSDCLPGSARQLLLPGLEALSHASRRKYTKSEGHNGA